MKKNKGITLVALVVTIVVLIILATITVNIALNGGIVDKTQNAKVLYENEEQREQALLRNITERLNEVEEKIPLTPGGPTKNAIAEQYGIRQKQNKAVQDNSEDKKSITIPEGYTVVNPKEDETINYADDNNPKVDEGIVIKDDNENQFVWIPVTEDLQVTYSDRSYNYLEPTELTEIYSNSNAGYDSQITLDYLYGTGNDRKYFDYEEEFTYNADYEEMKQQVEKYDGFYIGRYETTIGNAETLDVTSNGPKEDLDLIGTKYNATVLTSGFAFTNDYAYTETTSKTVDKAMEGQAKKYRWYGLYYVSKNTENVIGNGTTIQTSMINGQLYDRMVEFIGNPWTHKEWHSTGSAIAKSGQLNPKKGDDTGDVFKNIWDLESNCYEGSQSGVNGKKRIYRGR